MLQAWQSPSALLGSKSIPNRMQQKSWNCVLSMSVEPSTDGRVIETRGWTYKQQAVGFWSARCLSKLARTFRECGLVLTVDDALCECDALGEMRLESENLASSCYTNSAVALEELVRRGRNRVRANAWERTGVW